MLHVLVSPIRSSAARISCRRRSAARGRAAVWTPPGCTSSASWTSRRHRSWSGRCARLSWHARLVVLDLRGLAFMDSSGVHAIVDAGIRARQGGRRLIVLRGPPNVDRVFTLAGRRDDVEIHDLDPVEPPVQALLRLAVSTTCLMSAVRIFLLHHVTFSTPRCAITSAGDRSPTGDQSRNLAWLAPLAFGEAWHNNHHAFPTSARHGLGRRQLVPSASSPATTPPGRSCPSRSRADLSAQRSRVSRIRRPSAPIAGSALRNWRASSWRYRASGPCIRAAGAGS